MFKSKARTLIDLTDNLENAIVLPVVLVTYKNYLANSRYAFEQVKTLGEKLIVRSNSRHEDGKSSSNAGVFESVLNVNNHPDPLNIAIKEVFDSYGSVTSDDEVFIQPMLESVDVAGVAFSHDQSSGAPYFVINASTSGDTDSVTSGQKGTRTWYVRHVQSTFELDWQRQLCQLIEQLYSKFSTPIDIEFAFTKGKLYLLQVRPLIIKNNHSKNSHNFDSETLELEFSCINKKIKRINIRHPKLLGDFSAYAVMPDWNPAEIIGIKPKMLALSIYQEIITNSVWAIQRHHYGYRDVRGFPLLTSLGGTPYIDVRASFNSFIPNQLDEKLAEKLVNFYMSKLKAQPELHDKVEFEIVLSCFTFDIEQKITDLPNTLFSDSEKQQVLSSLTELTNQVLQGAAGSFEQDLEKIELLKRKQKEVIESDLNKIDKIYWLIDDCKKYGSLPFAGLARAGFIAVQLLNSLKSVGVLSEQDVHNFMLDVESISSAFMTDKQLMNDAELVEKYGHLRPGTYDICSARYDESPDVYLSRDNSNDKTKTNTKAGFAISLGKVNAINKLINKAGIKVDAIELLNFIKKAIEARESSKFVFTKSVSEVLNTIKKLGQGLNLSVDDMAFSDVKDILNLTTTSHSANETLSKSSRLGREYYQLCQIIKLPNVIFEATDINAYELLAGQPNYVTNQKFIGDVVVLNEGNNTSHSIANKIVFIDSADPGYDWVFSSNIGALVTKYGGVNSHMAIRAAELGVPAIIGAGEKNYDDWKQIQRLHIDCQTQSVEFC